MLKMIKKKNRTKISCNGTKLIIKNFDRNYTRIRKIACFQLFTKRTTV